MGEAWNDVCTRGCMWEARNIEVACVAGGEYRAIREGDCDWGGVKYFVNDVRVGQNEVACGTGVCESVVGCVGCSGGAVRGCIVVVVVVKDGKKFGVGVN